MRSNNYMKVNTVKGHLSLLGNSRAKAMTDNSNIESEDEQALLGVTIDSNLTFENDINSTTAQKMKISTKDFFSKCDQIRRKLRISSHILKKC